MPEQYQERQIAVKLRIKEINEGNYIEEEGWKPNYLLTKRGEKISRVNLMGVILDKEEKGIITNLVLDDGSGKIIVRSFEEIKNLKEIEKGEGILVVGRIRVFNNEKYISPEIVKKIEKDWLKVRSLELEKREREIKEVNKEKGEGGVKGGVKEGANDRIKDGEEFPGLADKKIFDLIKELDKGEGALIEEVKEKSGVNEVEEIIEKMLKEGSIFQNSSGRIKVL